MAKFRRMNYFGKYDLLANGAIVSLNEVAESDLFLRENPMVQFAAEQDTVVVQADNVHPERVTKYQTYEQIRYEYWQREKKLLINDSRYIPSKSGDELVLAEELEQPAIGLPIREKQYFNNDWLTIILIVALVLIASVRMAYAKYISSLFQSVFNYPTAFRLFGEKNNSIMHGAFRLEVLYYIIFSIFIFQVLTISPLQSVQASILFYGKTLGFLILYYLLKKLVYKFLGIVFLGVSETTEFIFNLDNFNRVTGILLFPIVALVAYYPAENTMFIIVAGIFAASFIYIMLITRGISILLKKQFPIFYLFLYLCTLEFLPLLLIYKVVVD